MNESGTKYDILKDEVNWFALSTDGKNISVIITNNNLNNFIWMGANGYLIGKAKEKYEQIS